MSIAFPGYSSPLAGAEAPLDMLATCHTRIERQCAILSRLVPHLEQHGADAEAASAAAGIIRYFDIAAPLHHADEEENLFPELLEAMAGSDAVCIREITASLAAEHRLLEADWRHLRIALAQIAEGRTTPLPAPDVEAFVQRYARHLEREDNELFPMASRLLGDAALSRMGGAMAQRRNLAPPKS